LPEDFIKLHLQEIKCVIMHWIQLAKDSPVAGSYEHADEALGFHEIYEIS
jgi:hypothetical protein